MLSSEVKIYAFKLHIYHRDWTGEFILTNPEIFRSKLDFKDIVIAKFSKKLGKKIDFISIKHKKPFSLDDPKWQVL